MLSDSTAPVSVCASSSSLPLQPCTSISADGTAPTWILFIDNGQVGIESSAEIQDVTADTSSRHSVRQVLSTSSETATVTGWNTELSLSSIRPVKFGCRKVYDKKNFCLFCGKCIKGKISRHLLKVHKDEARVMEVDTLAKGCTKHRLLLEQVANKGNFRRNADVLHDRSGKVVTT